MGESDVKTDHFKKIELEFLIWLITIDKARAHSPSKLQLFLILTTTSFKMEFTAEHSLGLCEGGADSERPLVFASPCYLQWF